MVNGAHVDTLMLCNNHKTSEASLMCFVKQWFRLGQSQSGGLCHILLAKQVTKATLTARVGKLTLPLHLEESQNCLANVCTQKKDEVINITNLQFSALMEDTVIHICLMDKSALPFPRLYKVTYPITSWNPGPMILCSLLVWCGASWSRDLIIRNSNYVSLKNPLYNEETRWKFIYEMEKNGEHIIVPGL